MLKIHIRYLYFKWIKALKAFVAWGNPLQNRVNILIYRYVYKNNKDCKIHTGILQTQVQSSY